MAAASLPHVYPFRLVDAVLRPVSYGTPGSDGLLGTEEGRDWRRPAAAWEGTVLARVTANGRYAMGAGWSSPLLLAEAIAQAALLLEGGDAEIGRLGFLAGLEGFEVLRAPEAGETLEVDVRLVAQFGAVVKFEGKVRVAEELIARGSVLVRKGEAGVSSPRTV